jgi:hypothetical protein
VVVDIVEEVEAVVEVMGVAVVEDEVDIITTVTIRLRMAVLLRDLHHHHHHHHPRIKIHDGVIPPKAITVDMAAADHATVVVDVVVGATTTTTPPPLRP